MSIGVPEDWRPIPNMAGIEFESEDVELRHLANALWPYRDHKEVEQQIRDIKRRRDELALGRNV